jgi:hypothetical protein
VDTSLSESEVLATIALNVLTGHIDPSRWLGLDRLDGDDLAVVTIFREIRRWGFGRLEITVVGGVIDTVHKDTTYKRRDLVETKQVLDKSP